MTTKHHPDCNPEKCYLDAEVCAADTRIMPPLSEAALETITFDPKTVKITTKIPATPELIQKLEEFREKMIQAHKEAHPDCDFCN